MRQICPLGIGLAILLATAAAAAPENCLRPNQPGATLLFPYFEVDLEFGGPTTLLAVANGIPGPRLARAVLWTQIGEPTYAFDLYLRDDGVVTVNLRDLFLFGMLPVTGPAVGPIAGSPSCTVPLANPPLDAATLLELRERHLAAPPFFGAPAADLLVGYLTVDVINDCSNTIRFPGDSGYFLSGGSGVASNVNALWGDFFLVDPSRDLAQGFEAVAIRAGLEFSSGPTFYDHLASSARNQRAPLGNAFSARFLNGATFDGGTDILVWRQPVEREVRLFTYFFDEDGQAAGVGETRLSLAASRFKLDDSVGLGEADFGKVDFEALIVSSFGGVPEPSMPIQTWVGVTMSAAGRFSVGVNATRLNDPCE
jgi:hypothetical protein